MRRTNTLQAKQVFDLNLGDEGRGPQATVVPGLQIKRILAGFAIVLVSLAP